MGFNSNDSKDRIIIQRYKKDYRVELFLNLVTKKSINHFHN